MTDVDLCLICDWPCDGDVETCLIVEGEHPGTVHARHMPWFEKVKANVLHHKAEHYALAAQLDQYRAWLVEEIAEPDGCDDPNDVGDVAWHKGYRSALLDGLKRLDEITGKGE